MKKKIDMITTIIVVVFVRDKVQKNCKYMPGHKALICEASYIEQSEQMIKCLIILIMLSSTLTALFDAVASLQASAIRWEKLMVMLWFFAPCPIVVP